MDKLYFESDIPVHRDEMNENHARVLSFAASQAEVKHEALDFAFLLFHATQTNTIFLSFSRSLQNPRGFTFIFCCPRYNCYFHENIGLFLKFLALYGEHERKSLDLVWIRYIFICTHVLEQQIYFFERLMSGWGLQGQYFITGNR